MFTTFLNTANTANTAWGAYGVSPKTRRNGLSGLARRRGRDRGLVLILVVALCATLAILGTTFLFISRTDRRRTSSIEYRQRANLAAQQLVAEARALLKDDLHLSSRPYENLSDANDFIDYPSDDSDPHLSFVERTEVSTDTFEWVHQTELPNTTYSGSANVTGYRFTDQDEIDGRGTAGELRNDEAKLFTCGSVKAAVRIIDLSGLINVNTGYSRTENLTATTPKPVHVGLMEHLQKTLTEYPSDLPMTTTGWDAFNQKRCNDTNQPIGTVYTSLASRLYAPETDYMPYALSDEPFLRWLGSNGEAISGRLWTYTKVGTDTLSVTRRQYLTTFNISRSILRTPIDSDNIREYIDALNLGEDGGGDARNNLFAKLVGSGLYDADEAGHLVANLWAWLDGQDESKAYQFTYSGGTVAHAFGVIPQPVFTKAYAKGKDSGDEENADLMEVQAVEVYNPTGMTIDLSNYRLKCGLTEITFDGKSLDSKERIVVVSKTDNVAGESPPDETFFPTPTGTVLDKDGIDFEANDVKLVRIAGGIEIPVDMIGLEYETPAYDAPLAEKTKRRDDDGSRQRYLVAAYATGPFITGHDLGDSNGVGKGTGDTNIGIDSCIEGFRISSSDPNDPETTGGLTVPSESHAAMMTLFLTGPDAGGKSLPEQLADTYATDLTRGTACVGSQVSAALANTPYPSVPKVAIAAEIFDNLESDTDDADAPGGTTHRYYGRININTAPQEVLEQLPWPDSGSIDVGETTFSFSSTAPTTREKLATLLIDYRDARNGVLDYSTRSNKGFRTPGEVIVPLTDYIVNGLYSNRFGIALSDGDRKLAAYQEAQGIARYLYGYISNLITVQSDVYAVYILLKDPVDDAKQWRYLAMIDRSNCWTDSDEPALLLFTPLK